MENINNLLTGFSEQKKLIELAAKQEKELQITLDKLRNYPMLLHSNDGEFVVRFEQNDF